MKVALVGQPNSGKSTLFNAVAGYRSLTSNFAGTTVEYTRGQARVGGVVLELIDLPGLYSLTPTSPVEEVSRDYLLAGDWDVIINVVDASQMARSLELTLELLDLQSPMVLCLNMMDEAARKGMTIDTHALATALGVPVVEAIGGRGRGILETFRTAQEVAASGNRPPAFVYAPDVEGTIEELAEKIAASATGQPVAIAKQSGASVVSRVIFDDGRMDGPPHPPAPLPQGGEGRVDFPALAPLGRGWLDEAFSSAEERRVRGSRLWSILRRDTTLGARSQRLRLPSIELHFLARQGIVRPRVADIPRQAKANQARASRRRWQCFRFCRRQYRHPRISGPRSLNHPSPITRCQCPSSRPRVSALCSGCRAIRGKSGANSRK